MTAPDYLALADEGDRFVTDRQPVNPWHAVAQRDTLIERMAAALRHAAQQQEALDNELELQRKLAKVDEQHSSDYANGAFNALMRVKSAIARAALGPQGKGAGQ